MDEALKDDELKKAIGQRIALQRIKLGLSQAKLAKEANISARIISQTERGINSLRNENLIKIAKVLGISSDYLLTGSHEIDDLVEIKELLSQLSPKQVTSIKMLIKAFIDAVVE